MATETVSLERSTVVPGRPRAVRVRRVLVYALLLAAALLYFTPSSGPCRRR